MTNSESLANIELMTVLGGQGVGEDTDNPSDRRTEGAGRRLKLAELGNGDILRTPPLSGPIEENNDAR